MSFFLVSGPVCAMVSVGETQTKISSKKVKINVDRQAQVWH
jgi:hypothetical protein